MWSRLGAAHRSGSLYLALSGASAVGAASFYALSQRDAETRRKLERDFDVLLAAERVKARTEEADRASRLRDAPVLWKGVVLQHDPRLQGHAMLRGSLPGSTVEVLEESVGADQRYLTVRNSATGAMGFLPIAWVRRDA